LVLKIINGKFETVWPLELASAPFILPDRDWQWRKAMINFRKITVGCDFSEYSKKTLVYAVALAEKFQADLMVMGPKGRSD
jgi:hypothetical protein